MLACEYLYKHLLSIVPSNLHVGMNKDESFTWAVFLPPLVTMLSELVGYWNAWKEIAFQISGIFWMILSSGGQLILN